MKTDNLQIRTIFGSLVARPKKDEDLYMKEFNSLPQSLRSLLTSAKTGAYITGLAKSHDIPVTKTAAIAFSIMQIVYGQKETAHLAAMLSSELSISNEKAQSLAAEIEKDLLAPVSLDLNNHLASLKKKKGSISEKQNNTQHNPNNPNNMLNLKNPPKPPATH